MRPSTFTLLLTLLSFCASSGCGLFGGANRKPRIEEQPPYYGKIERDGYGKEYVNVPMEHSDAQQKPYNEHKPSSKNALSSSGELEKLQKEANEYAADAARKKEQEKAKTEKKSNFWAWFKSGKSTDGMSSEAKAINESLEAKRIGTIR